jgi:hypothetical protein
VILSVVHHCQSHLDSIGVCSSIQYTVVDFILSASVQGNFVSLNSADYNVICILLAEHRSDFHGNVFACVSLIDSQISVASILLSRQDKRPLDFHWFTKHFPFHCPEILTDAKESSI